MSGSANQVTIDPAGIAAVRTSIERVLAQARRARPDVPFRTAADFPAYWRAATKSYGGDDLALRIATELPVGGFRRTSYAFASASSLAEAFEVFRRDSQRAVTGLETRLTVKGKLAELTMRGPTLLWPIFEILAAILALRCQQLPDTPVPIAAVALPSSTPTDDGPWRRLFGVRPRFEAGHASLAISAALMKLPLRTSDDAVRDALGGGGSSVTTADAVRAHVREWVRESPDVEHVARALGLSPRTLQRRLGAEKVTFRELVLDVKIEVAKQLLAGTQSVAEVASAVGFAGVAAFSQAFSRRTGMSPSRFRSKRA